MDYFEKKCKRTLESLIDIFNQEKLNRIEAFYICINFLLNIGEATYDMDFSTLEALKTDFRVRPTYGGALMLQAYALHEWFESVKLHGLEDKEWEKLVPGMVQKIAGPNAAKIIVEAQSKGKEKDEQES